MWNIAEPELANQPLAYMAGPTDNIDYVLAVGDKLRPRDHLLVRRGRTRCVAGHQPGRPDRSK